MEINAIKISEVVSVDFGIGGRLFGYISGVNVTEDSVRYNVILKVGGVDDDIFTEVYNIDSSFVKVESFSLGDRQ